MEIVNIRGWSTPKLLMLINMDSCISSFGTCSKASLRKHLRFIIYVFCYFVNQLYIVTFWMAINDRQTFREHILKIWKVACNIWNWHDSMYGTSWNGGLVIWQCTNLTVVSLNSEVNAGWNCFTCTRIGGFKISLKYKFKSN